MLKLKLKRKHTRKGISIRRGVVPQYGSPLSAHLPILGTLIKVNTFSLYFVRIVRLCFLPRQRKINVSSYHLTLDTTTQGRHSVPVLFDSEYNETMPNCMRSTTTPIQVARKALGEDALWEVRRIECQPD